jgi:hypothetical protein
MTETKCDYQKVVDGAILKLCNSDKNIHSTFTFSSRIDSRPNKEKDQMDSVIEESGAVVVKAKPTRKVFKGTTRTINKIPATILNDPQINDAIAALPANYNFEIHKTVHRIRETKAKRVALQMPEGLLMFACPISDIIQKFTDADTG